MGFIACLLSVSLFSCTQKKKQTNTKELFEKHYVINIKACAAPFIAKGVDTATAESICACLMETVYQLDSTVFLLDASEAQKALLDLMEDHKEAIEGCLSVINKDSLQAAN